MAVAEQYAGIFDEDDSENDAFDDAVPGKELLVYLIDSSDGMQMAMPTDEAESDASNQSYMASVLLCVAEDLKSRIISRDSDQVSIVFFNTREKKNIQESSGVYVWSELDVPSAQLIRDASCLQDMFEKEIGSAAGVVSGSRENPLYNALWVAQGLFRGKKGMSAMKRILLFTNNDDPFGATDALSRADMRRTTVQRAKDAADLGIEIDLYPMNRPGEEFNIRILYADMLQADDDDSSSSLALTAGTKFEDLQNQMKKRTFRKRVVRRLTLSIGGSDVAISLRSYAMLRPARIAKEMYVDAIGNVPIKVETTLVCQDTGSVLAPATVRRLQTYGSSHVLFSKEELQQVKRLPGDWDLLLLGFKPTSSLRDFHNIAPATFLYPDDKGIKGSLCLFVALHAVMLRQCKLAMALCLTPTSSKLVALLAQEERVDEAGQLDPPGFQMIHLPYLDDVRNVEKYHPCAPGVAPRATEEQVKAAAALLKKVDLKDFSMMDIQNPMIQTHYSILQAIALEEDTVPTVTDDTMPDYTNMNKPSVQAVVTQFRDLVYGVDYVDPQARKDAEKEEKVLKRKFKEEEASLKSKSVDWDRMADQGKLGTLTMEQMKDFLRSRGLTLTGKKADLVNRVLQALGK